MLCGRCPDNECRATLFFPTSDVSIQCTKCGQRHSKSAISEVAEVTNPTAVLRSFLKEMIVNNLNPKKGTDTVKVLGISNFQCKILSPFLTKYGMDKTTGRPNLLINMGQKRTFDCGVLCDRTFLIDPAHTEITGYGRDACGNEYLRETLKNVEKFNENQERLIPVHADGDGHCLVHAVSRALVGRELFWHALRENMKAHFESNLDKYKALFVDFVDADEWSEIISECDPSHIPRDFDQLGLRNIHIFALANVLRRPIVLLDSVSGMTSSGDYTGNMLKLGHSDN